MLDTGCSRTIVRQDLVPESKIIEGDAVTIRCAHGDTVLYPVAQLELEVDGLPLCVEAAVSKSLPVPVLLGTDVAELQQLLGESLTHIPVEDCMMVVTRTQAMRQLQEDAAIRSKELKSGAHPHVIVDIPEESESVGGEFADEIVSPSRLKTHKTRREKRNSRRQHWAVTRTNSTPESTGVSAAMLRELQQNDISLSKVCQSANCDVDCITDKSYYWHDGLLYRRWKPHGQDRILK